jgi:hypothetical protein
LLWDRGSKFERETIQKLDLPFTDLSELAAVAKEEQTLQAMRRGDQLIYGGRITHEDLIGAPDLLRREGNGYVPGDIKSGAAKKAPKRTTGNPRRSMPCSLAYTSTSSIGWACRLGAGRSFGTYTARRSFTTLMFRRV